MENGCKNGRSKKKVKVLIEQLRSRFCTSWDKTSRRTKRKLCALLSQKHYFWQPCKWLMNTKFYCLFTEMRNILRQPLKSNLAALSLNLKWTRSLSNNCKVVVTLVLKLHERISPSHRLLTEATQKACSAFTRASVINLISEAWTSFFWSSFYQNYFHPFPAKSVSSSVCPAGRCDDFGLPLERYGRMSRAAHKNCYS